MLKIMLSFSLTTIILAFGFLMNFILINLIIKAWNPNW